jgi:hypothetical protein
MRLGSEIDDGTRPVLGQERATSALSPISPCTNTWRASPCNAGQVVQVARIGQFVEVDDALTGSPSQSSTKLAPMKPAPPVTRIMG